MRTEALAQSNKASGAAAALWPLVVLLACATRPPGPPGPELQRGTLKSGGSERTFAYYRPDGAELHPLVLALHGRGGDGAGQDKLTHFSALARDERFVLVLPDGYQKSWHDARDFGPAAEAGIDDVAFLSALIDWAIANLGVDPARVYVTGMSNGAFMTNTLACRLGSRIAAIGAVTGGISEKLSHDCAPDRAPAVALVMGTADPLVPFAGGQVGGDRGEVLSAEASAKRWAALAACTGEPERSQLPDREPDDGTHTTRLTWSRCAEGREVRLYSVEGGGHTWPGGWKYMGEWAVGKVSRDFDASAELWAFFKTRSAPAVPAR